MTFDLKITRKEKNPDYKPPKDWNGVMRERYSVSEYNTFEVLSVEITPEQFAAIRKAVLEHF